MLRNITLLSLALIICTNGWAQRSFQKNIASSFKYNQNAISTARVAQESVFFPADADECSLTAWTFSLEDDENPEAWGFISGTNYYGDLEKAQRLTFTASDQFSVVSVLAFFDAPSIGLDGILTANVYGVDPTLGAPAELLGESALKFVSDIVVPDSFINATVFNIPGSMPIQPDMESFFVSIDYGDLYLSADTVTLFQTDFNCGSGDDTYERFSDGNWVAVNSDMSWGEDFDFFLAAIVEFDEATSADAFIANGGLKLHPAYPNPARHHVFIRYSLDQPSPVKVELFDLTGRKVMEYHAGFRSKGTFEEQLRTEHLTQGTYFYRLVTDHGELASRFQLRR